MLIKIRKFTTCIHTLNVTYTLTLTWLSDMPSAKASRALSGPARYLVCSKVFSRANIWCPENVGRVCFRLVPPPEVASSGLPVLGQRRAWCPPYPAIIPDVKQPTSRNLNKSADSSLLWLKGKLRHFSMILADRTDMLCVQYDRLLYFLARDSIYAIARYMPSPVRPSVCLSLCLSLCLSHGWISQRRLQLGLRNLHHRVAPWL